MCLIYVDDQKWKCVIYIGDWVGVKIYGNETMGLLDEKGLEAVAMVIKNGSCGDETMVAM